MRFSCKGPHSILSCPIFRLLYNFAVKANLTTGFIPDLRISKSGMGFPPLVLKIHLPRYLTGGKLLPLRVPLMRPQADFAALCSKNDDASNIASNAIA